MIGVALCNTVVTSLRADGLGGRATELLDFSQILLLSVPADTEKFGETCRSWQSADFPAYSNCGWEELSADPFSAVLSSGPRWFLCDSVLRDSLCWLGALLLSYRLAGIQASLFSAHLALA